MLKDTRANYPISRQQQLCSAAQVVDLSPLIISIAPVHVFAGIDPVLIWAWAKNIYVLSHYLAFARVRFLVHIHCQFFNPDVLYFHHGNKVNNSHSPLLQVLRADLFKRLHWFWRWCFIVMLQCQHFWRSAVFRIFATAPQIVCTINNK